MDIKEMTLGQMMKTLKIYSEMPITSTTFEELKKIQKPYEAKTSSLQEKLKSMTFDEIVEFVEKIKEQQGTTL